MSIFGLHILDIAIVVSYAIAMIYIGIRLAGGVQNQDDLYLGGRKLGRVIQFFLNFGNMTDANGAASVSSEVYRQGASGIWIGFQTLFLTPFYWFTAVWFRRCRVLTLGDLFVERFGSIRLGSLYAAYAVLFAVLGTGIGFTAAYKVTAGMVIKPASAQTQIERDNILLYHKWVEMETTYRSGDLAIADVEWSSYPNWPSTCVSLAG